jgi:hypothetical protein
MVDIKEVEKTCIRRIETVINYEKDPNLKRQLEDTGREICKCMSEYSTNPNIIHRIMNAAVRALPAYTVARPEKVKLKPE